MQAWPVQSGRSVDSHAPLWPFWLKFNTLMQSFASTSLTPTRNLVLLKVRTHCLASVLSVDNMLSIYIYIYIYTYIFFGDGILGRSFFLAQRAGCRPCCCCVHNTLKRQIRSVQSALECNETITVCSWSKEVWQFTVFKIWCSH